MKKSIKEKVDELLKIKDIKYLYDEILNIPSSNYFADHYLMMQVVNPPPPEGRGLQKPQFQVVGVSASLSR